MDNLIAAIAFFVVIELIVFAAFSWRIKELENRVKQLDWQQERLLMWYMNSVTVKGVTQDNLDKAKSKLDFEGWTGATICHSCTKKIDWHSDGVIADLGARVFCNDDCFEEWHREVLMKAEEKYT